ncbi:MAG TPA: hypothetical protein VML54_14090, partial [Candidatus Limnocylindrales bacterium]|nr:hypothetical protein [Candidatus Limnocylindrales bacterium]
MRRDLVVNVLLAAALALVAVTVVGLALLWPEQEALPRPPGLAPPATERAEIVAVRTVPCSPGQAAGEDCVRVAAELRSGPDEGREVEFTAGAVEGQFSVGDEIRMFPNNLPEGANVGGVPVDPYSFSDFERRPPILWLTA